MRTEFKKSASSYIRGYNNNAVVQLIIICGTAFVILQLTKVIMLMVGYQMDSFTTNVFNNVALPSITFYKTKFWTVLTYGWFHMGFWDLVTNMIWLYCFGAVVQMFIGYKQIIPLFMYSLIAGGIFYLLLQLIPGRVFAGLPSLYGPRAGIMGLAIAALTISPKYRFYMSPTFSFPLLLVVGIYTVLMVLYSGFNLPILFLLVGSGLMGYGYITLLRNGYKPGDWMYDLRASLDRKFSPDARAAWQKHNKTRNEILSKVSSNQNVSQKRIDAILDKINQKGYNSLSSEEKEILLKAGKENG